MRQAFWCHLVAVAPETKDSALRREEIHVKVKRDWD